MDATILGKVTLGAATAVGLHHGFFINQEWHLYGPTILMVHLSALVAYVAFSVMIRLHELSRAVSNVVVVFGAYLTVLLTSIVLHRLAFHRLSRAGFRGPLLARTSKIWHAWACRIASGPSEITITHPDVYQAIDGPGNVCVKAEWYDITHPIVSLVTTRDSRTHNKRRRVWDRGFTSKAVDRYKERALKHLETVEEHIATDVAANRSIAVNTIFSWLSFDVMGDFVFGKSFHILQNQEWRHIILSLREALGLLGPLTPVPWLAHLGLTFGGFLPSIKTWFSMISWCQQQMEDRCKVLGENESPEPDVSYWLFDDARKNGFTKTDWNWLSGDALLAIVAGSDTVASTLTGLFFRLASDPLRTEKLYAELAPIDCSDDTKLQTLPYLNAVVNETLRLHPALPTGGFRKTPEEGANICGRFIPGETTIIAPRHTIFRREDCFEKADSFVQERWCEHPNMVKNERGFMPFGTGRYRCIGRHLALAELRLITANLVKKYSISFDDRERASSFLHEIQDCFTARTGRLELRFHPRAVR